VALVERTEGGAILLRLPDQLCLVVRGPALGAG
jgi:hypothetical protein